ncbi:MAG: hypothetical protein HYY95_10030 [Candidatus Rokubacteria bacterium]|nr:hypothetical protein [Candidatus Rokubacteria bacterium]MBI3105893.1 hypothetical protein [Candidatus Rokubacteria bacterium]
MAAAESFVFQGCVQVCELVSCDAHDLRELLEQIRRVPAESIFCHTSVLLVHRPPLLDAYPNDFALWTDVELRDRRLTERLAAIDPFQLGSIEAVRAELVSTIEHHLQQLPAAPPRAGQPFQFLQYHLVPVPTGHQARTLREFRDALAEVDVSALFFHTVEARYRLGRGRGDFAEWIDTALGRHELAERLGHIDPYAGTLERVRERHLIALNRALEEGDQ